METVLKTVSAYEFERGKTISVWSSLAVANMLDHIDDYLMSTGAPEEARNIVIASLQSFFA